MRLTDHKILFCQLPDEAIVFWDRDVAETFAEFADRLVEVAIYSERPVGRSTIRMYFSSSLGDEFVIAWRPTEMRWKVYFPRQGTYYMDLYTQIYSDV